VTRVVGSFFHTLRFDCERLHSPPPACGVCLYTRQETEDYRLYEIMPDGSHRMVEFNETPYQSVCTSPVYVVLRLSASAVRSCMSFACHSHCSLQYVFPPSRSPKCTLNYRVMRCGPPPRFRTEKQHRRTFVIVPCIIALAVGVDDGCLIAGSSFSRCC
jgi:hypothetical protein